MPALPKTNPYRTGWTYPVYEIYVQLRRPGEDAIPVQEMRMRTSIDYQGCSEGIEATRSREHDKLTMVRPRLCVELKQMYRVVGIGHREIDKAAGSQNRAKPRQMQKGPA